MTVHRQHPRRGLRPNLFVAGGNPTPEDFRPAPPAGGPLEDASAGNLPAGPGWPADATEEEKEAARAFVRDAINWDREASAEPYQVDITRGLEDTVRMGNSLSAAVRLELLADRMREEAQDRPPAGLMEEEAEGRCGDLIRRDDVTGAELDPVDGLPVEDPDDEDDLGDEEDDATQVMPAVPPAPLTVTIEADTAPAADAFRSAVVAAGGGPRVMDWASRHDPASLDYAVRAKLRAPAPLVDRLWQHGPILDQGTAPPLTLHDASGCTGHAAANAANVLELATIHAGTSPVVPNDLMTHTDAMKLYQLAQTLDDWPGESYPGTSVLAAMKAGVKLGWWGSYLWAFGTKDVAQALLQVGPVVVGIPWLAKMSTPDASGILTVAGESLGGHALCLFAIRMQVAGKAGPWFGAVQSWGESVGDHGEVWIHHTDLARLLHGQGEAAIPVSAGVAS